MSGLRFFWFIPTHGDGRHLGSSIGERQPDFRYFQQIAQAADRLGYEGVLLPTGQNCEEGWITASGLAATTEKLKFLVALRPGVTLPSFAARQAAALDRLSNGRLLLNLVVGGNPVELAGDGVFLAHDERYRQADEFLTVFRGLLSGETVNFDGQYYKVEAGRLDQPPVQQPHPPVYLGGSSPAALSLAADHIDTYLTWGEPVAAVAEKIATARKAAEQKGRSLRFGIRLHFIVRETEAEAWDAANKLIGHVTDEQIVAAQTRFLKQMDSEGQRRMSELIAGRDRKSLEIAPNLWAGIGLVRNGAGTALVGTPEQVAARLREYQDVGIELVIGSGYPHLEEAYTVAELLLPELGLGASRSTVTRQIANEFTVGFHGAKQVGR